MKSNLLKQFTSLLKSLSAEKASLEARLREIDGVLLGHDVKVPTAKPQKRRGRPPGAKVKAKTRRVKNKLSLKEAVLKVLTAPMTKEEILAAIQKMGYRFATKNPLNSLGVILYGKKPKFTRKDGKFSVMKG